ncbi:MAG: phosphate ABC transporter permease PstA [Oligoflexia bacterium]|nr:phosphate ABC transporter permease PstA [Oligoflexia bacterium]
MNKRIIIRKFKDIVFFVVVIVLTLLTLLPLFMILKYILVMGYESFSLDFLFNTPRPIGELGGGMAHAIVGSMIVVVLAAALAIPLGIIAGTYLSEFKEEGFFDSKISAALAFLLDILASTPSIVLGIFSYVFLVLPWKSFSAVAGSVALSLVMIPIVAKSTEEILKVFPNTYREAGQALGLSKGKIIWHILIKCNRGSLLTGVVLALSRAMGETAPLLFTAFGNNFLSYNLTAPMATLPVQIFNYASSPVKDWQMQAWSGAMVLIATVFSINLAARLFLFSSSGKSNRNLNIDIKAI